MSKQSKQNVETKPITEGNDVQETDMAKNKLLMEIRTLKLLITQTENQFTPTKFKDLQKGMSTTQSLSSFGGSSQLSNVNVIFQNQLCIYAGFCCKKMDDEFLFAFPTLNGGVREKERCIQLFKDEERWRLGRWIMPLGIDVRAIFAKYSMDSHADIKYFLRECKHLLQCYDRREHEFKMLEAFMNHMRRYGCTVEALYQYTVTIMRLVTKRNSSLDETGDILVYLISKKDGVTPSKIKIDREGDNELSDVSRKKLRQFFHCFKEMRLIDAAIRTLASPDSPFIWKDAAIDDSVIEINDEEADDMQTSSLLQLLQKKTGATKKRRRDNTEVNESAYEKRENDLSCDMIEGSDPEGCEDETSQVDSHKNKKPKHATVKKAKPAARKSTAKKSNDVAKSGKVLSAATIDRPDPEICKVQASQVDSGNQKSKDSAVTKTKPDGRKSTAKETNAATSTNDRKNLPVVVLSDVNETRRASTKEYWPSKDCNDNFVSAQLEKNTRKKSEKSSKNNNEVQATVPQFFKLQRRVSSPAPADSNERPSKHNVKSKLAGPKFFQLQRQRINAPPTNINANLVTTPKGRSTNRLLSSTPISESTAIGAITEENISVIAKEKTFIPKILIDADKNRRSSDRSVVLDSDESDEKENTEVYNDQAALLKDLQEVKYNNNAMIKGTTKSVKQHTKPPSRGRNKISKK